MLTHSNISSSAEGVNYYSDCKIIDCEGKSIEISGWYGKGSKEIGLVGKVKMSDFKNILEGKINYNNKEIRLGIKTNDSNDLIHASGTDFTFNAPKSISNQANMIGGDRRINDSILIAAKETFDYIEKNYVYSRVKVAGQVIKEKVDNVVGAYFMENLNRENEYHSHVHFTFANMVQKQNGDWRSAEFRSIVENEKFLGAVFRMNLAHEMVKLGYEIEFTDTDQHFFEIRGSNKEFNNFTSQRTQNIIAKALEINPSNPNAKLKQIANLLTRANKKITGDNLVKLNEFRISEFFRKTKINILNNIKQLTKQANNSSATIDSKEIAKYAVKNAIEHHSERKSVFLKQDIISFALREVKGKCNLSHLLKEIDNFEKKEIIISNQKKDTKEFNFKTFTTKHALEREKATIQLMLEGQKKSKPITTKKNATQILNDINSKLKEENRLNEGQLEAAKAILTSKDKIHGIQGYAGTGKTYMLSKVKEVLVIINNQKIVKNPDHKPHEIIGLAPSGAAVKELQKVGINSQTLQSLLHKYDGYANDRGTLKGIKEEQSRLKNKIFVIDESSMIDAKQMKNFMTIASKLDIKTTLIGDIRQLASIGAGMPAYEMQKNGMSLTKMTTIRRQETKTGKAIAYAAYARDFKGIFEKVGSNLIEVSKKEKTASSKEMAEHAAKLYLSFSDKKRQETMIISQSNQTKSLVNQIIRKSLIEENKLSNNHKNISILINTNPTIAQKELSHTYSKNQVILFNKDHKKLNINKNDYYEIRGIAGNILHLTNLSNKKEIKFNIKSAKSFRSNIELYNKEKIEIRENDKITFTRKTEDHNIVNSTSALVRDIKEKSISLEIDNKIVEFDINSPSLKHIDHNYCITTHKSQGATTNNSIIIAESWNKKLTEERNILVQATRHKKEIYMVIDDKKAIIKNILNNIDSNQSSLQYLSRDPTFKSRLELSEKLLASMGGKKRFEQYKKALTQESNQNINNDNQKKSYLIPEYSTNLIQEKFKEAIFDHLQGSDFTNLDKALDQAFSNLGKRQYFGKKKKGELTWYGKAGYAKDYKIGTEPLKWGVGNIKISNIEKSSVHYIKKTKAEIERDRKEQELKIKKIEIEKLQEAKKVAIKANKIYSSLNKEFNHNSYLAKKDISEYSTIENIRFTKNGDIVLPIKDVNDQIWSLQTINIQSKRFLKGGIKQGNFFVINEKNLTKDNISNVILSEGFATGATIDKALNNNIEDNRKTPIVVCFDAGNVEHSLRNLKTKYPNKNYIIAADNDSIKNHNNIGVEKAIMAAKRYGAKVIAPKFNNLLHKDNLSSDFNDLHLIEGIKEVKNQFSHKENYKEFHASIDSKHANLIINNEKN